MMNMIVKAGTAVTVSVFLLSAAFFYLCSSESGNDAKYQYRMGITFLIASVIFGVLTWAVNEVLQVKKDQARLRKDVDARLFMGGVFGDLDDSVLRTLHHHEDK